MFDYLKEQYDCFVEGLLASSIKVYATVNISYDEIENSASFGVGSSLDGKNTTSILRKYPRGLESSYRIRCYPLDRSISSAGPYDYNFGGKFEPFDRWISCFRSTVAVDTKSTYFDYSEQVLISGTSYRIKAIAYETFGEKPVVHVFLEKTE